VVRVLRSPLDSLSCVLFPSPCALCGDPLLRLNRVPICESCWNSLPPQSGTLCIRCGEDLGIAQFSIPRIADESRSRANLICQPCSLAPPSFAKAVAYGAYEGQLRELIHLLKYDGMRPVAHRLGQLLAMSLESFLEQGDSEVPRQMLVVPVPLHPTKLRHRGFNHAALLAQAIIFHATVAGALAPQWDLRFASGMIERRRATVSQAGLTTRQRRQNLRGAFFAPRPAELAGRHILLVDDVYTTGATARACSRVLIDSGAASVRVVTVARAQREGVARWDAHFQRHAHASANAQQNTGPAHGQSVQRENV
jgi:ComF family protein